MKCLEVLFKQKICCLNFQPVPRHKNRFFSIEKALLVKMGNFGLIFYAKMGYNKCVFRHTLLFFLRTGLIVVFWAFIWRLVEPKTQLMRILRAALLVLGLLGIMAVLRLAG
jgi:hypothetical protein